MCHICAELDEAESTDRIHKAHAAYVARVCDVLWLNRAHKWQQAAVDDVLMLLNVAVWGAELLQRLYAAIGGTAAFDLLSHYG